MRLVIDANILAAALLKEATTRQILFEENLELFAPEALLTEINKLLKNSRIRKRIPLSDKDLSDLTSVILSRIIFFPEKTFLSFIKRSISLAPHIEDSPYIALSLALKIPIWSNDNALKQQSKIKVYTTQEVIKFIT